MRERHTLRDTDWNRVRHAFRRRTRVGRPSRDPRQILDGVCWILATGAPWRDLPSRFGPWQTVYGRFRAWIRDERLRRLLVRLLRRQRLDHGAWCVDTTVIRASRAAAGARRHRGAQGLGRSRGGFGTKVSIVCDGRGVPLSVVAGPGQEHDLRQVEGALRLAMARAGRPLRVIGDKAYSAAWLRGWLQRRAVRPVIPTRSDQRLDRRFSKAAYRRRNVVERLIGWLKESRRVATRYDKLLEVYLAFVELAFLRRLLRVAEFSNKP